MTSPDSGIWCLSRPGSAIFFFAIVRANDKNYPFAKDSEYMLFCNAKMVLYYIQDHSWALGLGGWEFLA